MIRMGKSLIGHTWAIAAAAVQQAAAISSAWSPASIGPLQRQIVRGDLLPYQQQFLRRWRRRQSPWFHRPLRGTRKSSLRARRRKRRMRRARSRR